MTSWLRARAGSVATLARRNGTWWWERRLRIADWCYAVFTLPFSGMAMVLGAGGNVGFTAVLFPTANGTVTGPWAVVGLIFLVFVVPGVVGSIAMLWRRSSPKWLMLTGLLLLLLYGNPVPMMVGLYSYPAHFSERRPLVGWFALSCLCVAVNLSPTVILFVMSTTLFLVVPTIAGLWIGTRRQLIDRLQERAERLEREQHMMAEQAIGAERTRIAREMHDVIGHSLNAIAVQAEGVRHVLRADADRADRALADIGALSRAAVDDVRDLLDVLAADESDSPVRPTPTVRDVPELIGSLRYTSAVRLRIVGDADAVPDHIGTAAYRIVQEGLTNALKHARGAPVTVHLAVRDHEMDVTILNTAATARAALKSEGGHGIAGMRERVRASGGILLAGPDPATGGWRVSANLPWARA